MALRQEHRAQAKGVEMAGRVIKKNTEKSAGNQIEK
jgi:hypothetical protein